VTKTHDIHPSHRMRPILLAAVTLLATTAAWADPPDVQTLVRGMQQALEPPRPSLRKITLTVAQGGTTNQVTLGQARGKADGGNRILTVVLAPADLRGTAYLVQEQPESDADRLWVFLPAIGRVREVVGPEGFSAFLNSDFTYADLGFTALRFHYESKGETTANGVKAYRLEAVPKQNWYYAKVVSLIAADTLMPIERDFFDPANQPWKVERFEKLTTINGVPTPLTIAMDDTQAKSKSTLDVTSLQYDAQIPAALLQPQGLPQAVSSPLWASLTAPVGK
jgi:uncharacterized protein